MKLQTKSEIDAFLAIWNRCDTARDVADRLGCTAVAAKAHAKRLRAAGHDVVIHAAGRPRDWRPA